MRCFLLLLLLSACVQRPSLKAPSYGDEGDEGDEGGEVRVEREQMTLSCDGERAKARCRVEARYELTREPASKAVAAETRQGLVVHSRVRGRTVHLESEPIEPQEPIQLHRSPVLTRHDVFSRFFDVRPCELDEKGCRLAFEYTPTRHADRAPGYELELRVEVPDAWNVDAYSGYAPPGAEGPDPIVTEIDTGQRGFAPGGPFGGIGVQTDGELWWRGGWEVFAPHRLAHALSAEGNGDKLVVVPSVEAVSDAFLFLPSLGIGLGMPIVLDPAVEAGGRLFFSMQFPYLGVFSAFDVYVTGEEPRAAASLFLTLSL